MTRFGISALTWVFTKIKQDLLGILNTHTEMRSKPDMFKNETEWVFFYKSLVWGFFPLVIKVIHVQC